MNMSFGVSLSTSIHWSRLKGGEGGGEGGGDIHVTQGCFIVVPGLSLCTLRDHK
jgi:hypothetical protein